MEIGKRKPKSLAFGSRRRAPIPTALAVTALFAFLPKACATTANERARSRVPTTSVVGRNSPTTTVTSTPTTTTQPPAPTTPPPTSAPTTVASTLPASITSQPPTTTVAPTTTPTTLAPTTTSAPAPSTTAAPTTLPPTTTVVATPSAYPGPDNTGVTPGTTLRVITGGLAITTPTVLENVEIRGNLYIAATASGTIVRNVRIAWPAGQANPGGSIWTMVDNRASNVLFEDCEVNGNGMVQTGMTLANGPTTVRRCEISGTADGVDLSHDITITDSYIHGMSLGPAGDWHVDTVQVVAGTNLVLRHNTILNENPQTSAVGIWSELGPVDNVLVEDNLIGGGGYTIYTYQMSYSMTRVRVVNNKFTTAIYARIGYWATDSNGYCGILYPTGLPADLDFSGNVVYETGAAVTK